LSSATDAMNCSSIMTDWKKMELAYARFMVERQLWSVLSFESTKCAMMLLVVTKVDVKYKDEGVIMEKIPRAVFTEELNYPAACGWLVWSLYCSFSSFLMFFLQRLYMFFFAYRGVLADVI